MPTKQKKRKSNLVTIMVPVSLKKIIQEIAYEEGRILYKTVERIVLDYKQRKEDVK